MAKEKVVLDEKISEIDHLRAELEEFYDREGQLVEMIVKLDKIQKMTPMQFASPYREVVNVRALLKSLGHEDAI